MTSRGARLCGGGEPRSAEGPAEGSEEGIGVSDALLPASVAAAATAVRTLATFSWSSGAILCRSAACSTRSALSAYPVARKMRAARTSSGARCGASRSASRTSRRARSRSPIAAYASARRRSSAARSAAGRAPAAGSSCEIVRTTRRSCSSTLPCSPAAMLWLGCSRAGQVLMYGEQSGYARSRRRGSGILHFGENVPICVLYLALHLEVAAMTRACAARWQRLHWQRNTARRVRSLLPSLCSSMSRHRTARPRCAS